MVGEGAGRLPIDGVIQDNPHRRGQASQATTPEQIQRHGPPQPQLPDALAAVMLLCMGGDRNDGQTERQCLIKRAVSAVTADQVASGEERIGVERVLTKLSRDRLSGQAP